MDRDLLAHFPIVIAVARRGGFAAAASALNMSPSAVSHAVKAVEDRLGQPLFARTTRSVALTEAGADFVASIGPALAMVEESIEHIRAASGDVAGLLRINAPRLALPLAITPAVVEMSRLHPGLTIEVTSDESLVDIVASGYDAGVRLGEMIAEDMVTVRLTPRFKTAMVASPKYQTVPCLSCAYQSYVSSFISPLAVRISCTITHFTPMIVFVFEVTVVSREKVSPITVSRYS